MTHNAAIASASSTEQSLGWIDRLCRRSVLRQLSQLSRGELVLEESSSRTRYGEAADLQAADLQAVVHVHDPRFFRQSVLGGTLAVAESYLAGEWDCSDLTAFFRIFLRNAATTNQFDGPLTTVRRLANRVYHALNRNSHAGSRRNIHAHYDLGNEFFAIWLDDSWAYSSGIFAASGYSLYDSSLEKFDRVCRKLNLQPDDELLEIGGGWGGFAIHAARHYDCQVTTTTISSEQYQLARQRVDAANLGERVKVLQCDYRDLSGKFDRLASIEMIESVGHRQLGTFFRQCSSLLNEEGSLVLQAIVMPERGYDQYLRSVDFIQRYVFPGGCLPSLAAMLNAAGKHTDLRLVHAEDFAPHYAETLRRWRRNFWDRIEDVRRLGYSERFIRLWHYYLCYCEAAFEERYIGVMQVQFDKPQCRRDPLELSQRAATLSLRNDASFMLARNNLQPIVSSR